MDKPIFTTSLNKDLWALILEKAYAKLFGNYQCLDVGDIRHSLVDFTGCPVFTFRLTDAEIQALVNSGDLWQLLVEWKRQKFLIAAGTKNFQEEKELLEDHAYGVLRAVEVDDDKILNLRNPWGEVDWEGDWSPKSSKWTPQIRELLGVSEVEKDSFWISFEDFVQNFDVFHVCKMASWTEGRATGKFVQTIDKNNEKVTHFCSDHYYELTLSSYTKIVVGVHQED